MFGVCRNFLFFWIGGSPTPQIRVYIVLGRISRFFEICLTLICKFGDLRGVGGKNFCSENILCETEISLKKKNQVILCISEGARAHLPAKVDFADFARFLA